jgi:hypothetical protein
MMRGHAIRVATVVLGIVAIGFLALTLKDTRDTSDRKGYEAGAPTGIKFARLARWIPKDSEFDVTVDVHRALAHPELRGRIARIAASHVGVAAELVSALLENQDAIGLLTIFGTLGSRDDKPSFVIVAQGDFDEEVILPAIRSAMSEGRAGLSAMNTEWSTIYYESDVREPFGFVILDGSHMAVGQRSTLEAFYLDEPAPPEATPQMSEDVLFGHLTIGARIRSVLPKNVPFPEAISFASQDGIILTATAPFADELRAMSARMFIEGIRSLITLQHEHNMPLVGILEGITITPAGSDLMITTKLAPLLDLWESESDDEGDDSPGPDVDEPPVRKF